jgi:coproporphyrinogen III oxidase-like Fe-S oxidoreductase
MLRLRLLQDGLNLSSFERRFGVQEDVFYAELLWHIEQGNLDKKENLVKLSEKGIIFADRIIADLFI